RRDGDAAAANRYRRADGGRRGRSRGAVWMVTQTMGLMTISDPWHDARTIALWPRTGRHDGALSPAGNWFRASWRFECCPSFGGALRHGGKCVPVCERSQTGEADRDDEKIDGRAGDRSDAAGRNVANENH